LRSNDKAVATGAGGSIGGHLVGAVHKRGFASNRAVDVKPLAGSENLWTSYPSWPTSVRFRVTLGMEMDLRMAHVANGDEVFFDITSQMAARLHVVHLDVFGIAAALASPAIALESRLAKPLIRVPF
jgi:hypothetical protein